MNAILIYSQIEGYSNLNRIVWGFITAFISKIEKMCIHSLNMIGIFRPVCINARLPPVAISKDYTELFEPPGVFCIWHIFAPKYQL